ncbi:MAG: TonB-dependent receptor [Melioribacteraceae bacterium]|nr:TonB-dependent receptor [Melioribacteraceae bacterium]
MIYILKRRVFITLFFLILVQSGFAQKSTITGLVVDYYTNEPVSEAVVKSVEIERFTTTDFEGKFKLLVNSNFSTLTLETTHLAYKESIFQISKSQSEEEKVLIYLLPKTLELDKVLVSDYKIFSKFDDLKEISMVLKGKELQRHLGITLASTLKNEIGLAIRSMGPAPARPVIRGMGSNRVFISEDGNKTIDLSATSPDHAVTIDPFNLNRIEILRGPKVLTKTSVSTGGIINVVKNEIPVEQHGHPIVALGTYGESVNRGFLMSGLLEIPFNNFALRGEISERKSFNLNTPLGKLNNSSSENLNFSFGGSYFLNNGFIGVSFKKFDLDYGVPGGFIGAHPNGVDISMFREQLKFKSQLKFNHSIIEKIEFSFVHALYRHKEFENKGTIGSEFRIVNNNGFINLSHTKFGFLNNGLIGISFEHRDFDIGGFVFTSPAISINSSAYLYEYFTLNNFTFEFSSRYNFSIINPENKTFSSQIGNIRKRDFQTYSFSFSTLYELTKKVHLGFNINKSSRVPTIEELYSKGPHLAAYSYEIGNPDLENEHGIGAELFIYHKLDNLYFNINLFRNDFSYYIIPRATGEINYQTFLPIYKTIGTEALFYGIEKMFEWKPSNNLRISNSISYTRGKFKNSETSLPQIPPLKGNFVINYYNSFLSGGLETEWASKQNKVDEFEDPTASYIIFNTFMQFSISKNSIVHNLSFSVDNIFDKEYYNHLSRIKSILPEAGRNFKLTYKLYYNL